MAASQKRKHKTKITTHSELLAEQLYPTYLKQCGCKWY